MLKILRKINWGLIFGVFFFFLSLGLLSESFLAAFFLFLISLILIPQTFSYLKEKITFINLEKAKFLIVASSFFLALAFTPKTDLKNNDSNKQKNIISPSLTSTPTLIPSLTPTPIFYPVVKVVDGDTFDVEVDGQTKRIRVIGINTPEVVDPRKTVECFGKEASEKAKSILLGKKVNLERDPTQGDTDKYGRLLRYVFLEDGTDFGLLMIKQGYAYEYTYNFPYKYQNEYKKAQKQAEELKIGLWADNACVTPTQTSKTTVPIYIPSPTTVIQNQTSSSTVNESSGGFVCNCSKTCSQMISCEEAYFQLNTCGCSARDEDRDGVPCESICPGG
jgi:micrococcal nuclease